MPKALEMVFTDEFALCLADVDDLSPSKGMRIREAVRRLQAFPDMGSPRVCQMLKNRYGDDLRTLAVEGYVIVYRHDEQKLCLIALPWGGRIR